ncbi:unnamed protein product [Heligmosomoides polygyrus]|uniref:DDE_3 domain-containing protein n=1 Tax=Heligmosomoides polygyrus TaxID=6339 RepID=A0A183FMZ7_HELPZ|nr:unnamed protein product [Heligmosomoides polygyrus]
MDRMAVDLGVSRRTIQKIVKQDLGLCSYRLYREQALTKAAMQIGLEKSKLLLKEIWQGRLSNVIWTDEKISAIEVAHNSQSQRQLLPPSRNRSPERRVLHRTLFPKTVMAWAGITLDKKTPLVFVDRSVKINTEVYQEKILRHVLLPWDAENFVSGQCLLQQDWAPAHSARSTLAFCESQFPDYWTKDFWPPNSPDLNPMDFAVWGYLQQKVSSKSDQSLNALKAPLQKA